MYAKLRKLINAVVTEVNKLTDKEFKEPRKVSKKAKRKPGRPKKK